MFDYSAGVDEHGRYRGQLRATGVRPRFTEKLADQGIRLGPEVFAADAGANRAVGRG
jgi:pilus assembly protein CpaF